MFLKYCRSFQIQIALFSFRAVALRIRNNEPAVETCADHEGLALKEAQRGYCIYRMLGSRWHENTALSTLKHLQPIFQISSK